jgi:hypothetical protein
MLQLIMEMMSGNVWEDAPYRLLWFVCIMNNKRAIKTAMKRIIATHMRGVIDESDMDKDGSPFR